MRKLGIACFMTFAMGSCQIFNKPQKIDTYSFLEMYINGVSMRLQEHFDIAAQHLEACLNLQPQNSQVHYQLALLRNQMKQPEAACYHAWSAFRLQPNQIEYARCLESVFTNSKQHARVLKDMCRRFPNDITFRDKLLMCFIKQGAFNQALEECRVWNIKNGNDPQIISIQAGLLKTLHRHNEALILLESATQSYNQDIQLWIALAESYERINDTINLVRVCNSILKLQPNTPKALGFLMLNAIRSNQPKRAEAFYQDFLMYCKIDEWKMLYQQLEVLVSKEQLQQKWILPFLTQASDRHVKTEMKYKAIEIGLPEAVIIRWIYDATLTASSSISFLQHEFEKRQWDSLFIHSKLLKQQFPEMHIMSFYQIRARALLNRITECSDILKDIADNVMVLDAKKKAEWALWNAIYNIELNDAVTAQQHLKTFKAIYPEHTLGFIIEAMCEHLLNNQSALLKQQQAALLLWTNSVWDTPFDLAVEYLSKNLKYDVIFKWMIQNSGTPELGLNITEHLKPHVKK